MDNPSPLDLMVLLHTGTRWRRHSSLSRLGTPSARIDKHSFTTFSTVRRFLQAGALALAATRVPYTAVVSDPSSDTPQALQHAALGAIDAVRGLLDAAEEIVGDPRHLQDVVAGMGDWAEKVATVVNPSSRGDGAGEDDATVDVEGDDPHEADSTDSANPERLRRIPLD